MLWREFAPYVMPHVIGCPIPVMEHHARLTAIDWCRKTLILQRELDPVVATGLTHDILITPPALLTVVKVLAVAVDGREFDLVEPRVGQKFERSQHPGDFAFTRDNAVLRVFPMPAEDIEVEITAALMPSLNTSTGLDDDVALEHADDIAKGIVAAIQMLPKQDFSDPAMAQINQAKYEDRRSTIAAKVMRGMSAAKTRTPTKFY